jgi:hypothetical protein
MDRRNFLRFLSLGAVAAVAPTKAYSFLGGILRPRGKLVTFADGAVWPESFYLIGWNQDQVQAFSFQLASQMAKHLNIPSRQWFTLNDERHTTYSSSWRASQWI